MQGDFGIRLKETEGDKEEAEGEEEKEKELMRWREEEVQLVAGLRQPGLRLWDVGTGEGSCGFVHAAGGWCRWRLFMSH